MNRFVLAFALLALGACQSGGSGAPAPTAAEPPADPRFVLPGAFSEDTTLEDLQKLYGAENVKVTKEPDGYGGTHSVILLFPDDPTRRATVLFHYEDPLRLLASITVTEPTSIWRGKQGVRVGTSFAELRAKNGRAFYFGGFDEQGRGTVRDWWDVGQLDVTEGERLYFAVDLQLREAAKQMPGAAPSDYAQTSSDDPSFPLLGELVTVSAISAWSSLDDEWSRAPRSLPSALALRRP